MSNNNIAQPIRALPNLQRTMSISSESEPEIMPFAALTRDPFAALTRAPSAMPTLQRTATLMPLQEQVIAPATLPPLIRTASYRPVDGLKRSATLSHEPVLHPVAETYAPVLLNEMATARDTTAMQSIFSKVRHARAALPGSSLRRTDYDGPAYAGGDRTYGGGPEEELANK